MASYPNDNRMELDEIRSNMELIEQGSEFILDDEWAAFNTLADIVRLSSAVQTLAKSVNAAYNAAGTGER